MYFQRDHLINECINGRPIDAATIERKMIGIKSGIVLPSDVTLVRIQYKRSMVAKEPRRIIHYGKGYL